MEKENFWKRFQEHMGYTDDELEMFKSDPMRLKMVTETPEFVKKRIIAEVIESHGCHAGHKVGQCTTPIPNRYAQCGIGVVSYLYGVIIWLQDLTRGGAVGEHESSL